MTLDQLKRVRWAVRGALLLGVSASVTANVLHAVDNPISQAIAAWPPIALLITVELISRVPVHRTWLAILRVGAVLVIAGIAAWVSYWHMVGVTARYGEAGVSPYLIPISVDGLIVVASISLLELAGRITESERRAQRLALPAPPTDPAMPTPDGVPAAPPVPDRPLLRPAAGADATDEVPVQRVRQDARTAHEIELAVRAIWTANPSLSQRRIAAAAGTSPTNAGRIIREAKAAATDQPEPAADEQPEPVGATSK